MRMPSNTGAELREKTMVPVRQDSPKNQVEQKKIRSFNLCYKNNCYIIMCYFESITYIPSSIVTYQILVLIVAWETFYIQYMIYLCITTQQWVLCIEYKMLTPVLFSRCPWSLTWTIRNQKFHCRPICHFPSVANPFQTQSSLQQLVPASSSE